MPRTRSTAASALGIAAVLALSGCGSSGDAQESSGAPAAVPAAEGEGETLTVWVMDGDYTDETIEAINTEFTETVGAEVEVEVQQWEGITTKVSTALSTSTPPDVIDLGNTQVPGYAANGALLDLTPYKEDLQQGRTWLAGLEEPATVDGSLYAVPGFAGARAVIYNKELWAAAGVTEAPTTTEELTAALDAVAAANTAPDFSPFYLPGQYWYAGMQWVWDAGGDIATSEDGTWTGGFSSPEAQEGLEAFKAFQNAYSTPASQTVDTLSPDQVQLFADGKTSAILATAGSVGLIQEANPALTDDSLGTFPLPGTSGATQPVMLGGSDWGIAARSENPDLALAWTKIAASPAIQDEYVFGVDGWIPNSTEGIEAAQASLDPLQQGFFTAALVSKATPAAADWPTIEGDKSINELFSAVASGSTDVAAAAEGFDEQLESTLNSGR